MKILRRVIAIALLLLLGFIVVAFVFAVQHARVLGRRLGTLDGVKTLAVHIEAFKEDHGRYPASLRSIESAASSQDKATITEILHVRFRNKYEYRPLTNGFWITVHGEKYEYQSLTNGYNLVAGNFTNEFRWGSW